MPSGDAASICIPASSTSHSLLKPITNPLLGHSLSSRPCLPLKRRASFTTKALVSTTKESVLNDFHERRALKIIQVCRILTKKMLHQSLLLRNSLTSLPVCVSSVDPAAFPAAVEAGALMVEIGNYDSFYEMGVIFTPQQILNLAKETKRILPSVALSVTVPHTLSLPDQACRDARAGRVDIIQTEGGKCSKPSQSGVLGLIEKATPTLAAAYSISRAVKIPVMCSSGLSAVTAPMAITAGAAGVEYLQFIRSISWYGRHATSEEKTLKL
ncbi:hypothetical protein M0R45_013566 [Rubus argutus]|uniref:Uncharacterized protein ycf23 n=1 Tax=Rubus argutus TaxID=59490 RepID=A0AAW1XIU5_RUBAR